MEALMKSASAFSERFRPQFCVKNPRNTGYISGFLEAKVGQKDPLKAADDCFRVSL